MYRSMHCLFALVVTLGSSVRGQVVFFGECPTQAVVENFDTAQYLGKWYENRNYFAVFQLLGTCVTATYTDQGNGIIGVANRQIDITDSVAEVNGWAKLADPSKTEAKLSVAFGASNPFEDDPTAVTDANYLVLDTDYTSYSIVWSCQSLGIINTQIMWILTRDRVPSAALMDTILAKITERGLSTDKLKVTDQTYCQ